MAHREAHRGGSSVVRQVVAVGGVCHSRPHRGHCSGWFSDRLWVSETGFTKITRTGRSRAGVLSVAGFVVFSSC